MITLRRHSRTLIPLGVTIFTLTLALAAMTIFPAPADATNGRVNKPHRIGHATIRNVTINGKDGRLSVSSGSKLSVKLDFVSDSSRRCPKCQNQIIISFAKKNGRRLERVAGGRCIYSNDGHHSKRGFRFNIKAPKTPGHYRMIVMAPQAYNCQRALQYQPRLRSIAALRVR